MVSIRDIHSLTDFKRNTTEFMERLKRTGRPEVLTVNGGPGVVVMDAGAFAKIADEIAWAHSVAGIRRGLEDAKAGRVRPAREAIESLRKLNRRAKAS